MSPSECTAQVFLRDVLGRVEIEIRILEKFSEAKLFDPLLGITLS